MDPATLAMISMAGSAASGTLGAVGALGKGSAQKSMYEYQAGVSEFNRKISLQNRDYAMATGEAEAGRYGLKAAANAGSIRAKQGASGVVVNTGSAADVQESAHKLALMDMATIRSNAARVAYGHTVEAAKYEAEGGMYRAAGANAKKAGMLEAMGSLISGATSVSSKWMQASQSGILGKQSSDWLSTDPNTRW